jgi:hypothetical protein
MELPSARGSIKKPSSFIKSWLQFCRIDKIWRLCQFDQGSRDEALYRRYSSPLRTEGVSRRHKGTDGWLLSMATALPEDCQV